MKINHIGYLVNDIESSLKAFQTLGFNLISKFEDNFRNIDIVFVSNDNYTLELIQPKDTSSVVYKLLNKNGPTPYHICYEVDNIDFQAILLKKQGYIIVVKKEKAIAFNNRNVVFMYNKNIGLIELVEENDAKKL
jgi:methylmalonyl-CoA/ethylmalonyl-CoA epimerase